MYDVLHERRRQLQDEGCAESHDDQYDSGELAAAAACYTMNAACLLHPENGAPLDIEALRMLAWPWGEKQWKPKDARRDLVRAAALIVAEIERLDRAAALQPDDGFATEGTAE